MKSEEYLREKANILSLMERSGKNFSFFEAEKNKEKWLNEEKQQWKDFQSFKEYRAGLNKAINDEELLLYYPLMSEATNLPVNIYLPERKDSVSFPNPEWVYVENAYCGTCDVFPLSVSDKPMLMVEGFSTDISDEAIDEVKNFISANYKAIHAFHMNEIGSYTDLEKQLVRSDKMTIYEFKTRYGVGMLNEYYVKLDKEETGLPVDIWVDNGATFMKGGHAPRIKFPGSPAVGSNSMHWSSMTIEDEPKIFNMPVKKPYKAEVTNAVAEYVRYFKDQLLNLSKGGGYTIDDLKRDSAERLTKFNTK